MAETLPDKIETSANTKTRVVTAGLVGALGVAGYLIENYGVLKGQSIPFEDSLKHPLLGYYSALAVSKAKQYRTAKILAAGLAADAAAETGQDLALSADHSVHWTHFEANQHPNHGNSNLGNIEDAVACMAASVLFLAQNGNTVNWLRTRVSKAGGLVFRQPLQLAAEPAPDPSGPNLVQSGND